MEEFAEVVLHVPKHREQCAFWIKSQCPETVASVLDLSAATWQCLQNNVSSEARVELIEQHTHALNEQRERFNALENQIEVERNEHHNILQRRLTNTIQEYEERLQTETVRWKNKEQKLQEEYKCDIVDIENKRAAEKEGVERKIEEARGDAMKRYERQVNMVQSDLQNALEEVKRCKGNEAMLRAEVGQQYDVIRAQDRLNHDRVIEQLRADHGREVETLKQRMDELRTQEDYFKCVAESRAKDLREAEENNKRLLSECNARMEHVLSRNCSTHLGKAGESSVEQIFSTLCLGNWSDESGKALEGYGDALWTYDSPQANCIRLQCLVEVKNVAILHSEHDLAKFKRDIVTGAKNGRINAGMLISLNAHISDTRQIDLTSVEGVPVLRASRTTDDPMPLSCLVRMAFYCFAQIWPALCRQRVDNADATIVAVCDHLDGQVECFARLSKTIEALEKNTCQIQRQIVALKKTRDSLVSANDCLRINHPELTAVAEVDDIPALQEDPWKTEAGILIIEAIKDWRMTKGGGRRYPKTYADLDLNTESAYFMQKIPNAFIVATKIVKDSFQVKKRKHDDADADGYSDGLNLG